jgi:endonuclease/exonuclease/phosphatase family metal-dependent hydrolase
MSNLSGGLCSPGLRRSFAMVRILSWNVNQRDVASELRDIDADLALLQEAPAPLSSLPGQVLPDAHENWKMGGPHARPWRTAIIRLSDRVEVERRPTSIVTAAARGDWIVSLDGSITAADVLVDGKETPAFTAVSVYAGWETATNGDIYADASAHRILSDLSALMPSRRHRLVVAGDWNILHGYGEHGNTFFRDRYRTVFDRAEALGLVLAGPQAPNGRQADPWPAELPPDSRCVPTYHHNRQKPSTATRQLDFVFVSRSLASGVTVTALNGIDQWGPSDHCRIQIDINL